MGLFDFLGNSDEKEKEQAQLNYERACSLEGDSREKRGLRIRQAVRARIVIDKIFVDGTRSTAGYEEARMVALASGEDIPPYPCATLETCFKSVNTVNGKAMAYLPITHATNIFAAGQQFQMGQIDKDTAINLVQVIADAIGDELGLDQYAIQPITPLEFLLRTESDFDIPLPIENGVGIDEDY